MQFQGAGGEGGGGGGYRSFVACVCVCVCVWGGFVESVLGYCRVFLEELFWNRCLLFWGLQLIPQGLELRVSGGFLGLGLIRVYPV